MTLLLLAGTFATRAQQPALTALGHGKTSGINKPGGVTADTATDVTTTGGTPGVVPVFNGTSTVINSNLFYSSGRLGIGITPGATLDVSGTSFFGGATTLQFTAPATTSTGHSSSPLLFQASSFNSSSSTVVNPFFEMRSESANNNTSNPGATLNLLYGVGTAAPAETGFYVSSNGVLHFASAQTFPITQGPQGPTGPQGPQGPAGSSGTAGPDITVSGAVTANNLATNAASSFVLAVKASNNNNYSTALQANANGTGGTAIEALADESGGVGLYAYGAGYAGQFYGNVSINGTLTKPGGSFKIDDPLDPENKYLSHSFVESPDMMNIYNGNVTTDGRGEAVVTMPDYFEALNRDFRYQLTVIGQFAQAIVGSEISNGVFTIRTDKPGVKVSWQVTGVRQDAWANAHRIPNEEPKPERYRGHFLHPELFGHPEDASIGERGRQTLGSPRLQ